MEEKIFFLLKNPVLNEQFDSIMVRIKNSNTKLQVNFIERFIQIYLQKQKQNFLFHFASIKIISALFLKDLVIIDSCSLQTLLKLINYLSNVLNTLRGLEITSYTNQLILKIIDFIILSQLYQKDLEVKDFLLQIKNKKEIQNFCFHESYKTMIKVAKDMAISQSISNKIKSCQMLFDIFSECNNYDEQLLMFSQEFTEIIKDMFANIQWNSNKEEESIQELMINISKISLTILPKTSFIIEFKKNELRNLREINPAEKSLEYLLIDKEETEDELSRQQQIFTDESITIDYDIQTLLHSLQQNEDIYHGMAIIVNSMLLFPKNYQIMKNCLILLERYFEIFPKQRTNIEQAILTVMQNIIDNATTEDQIKDSAIFSYKLLNSTDISEEFRQELMEREQVCDLCESKYWCEEYQNKNSFLNSNLCTLDNLLIRSGFAIAMKVEPEQDFFQTIEVKKPFSIIYFGFATYQNDIQIQIIKILNQKSIQIQLPRIYYQGKINSEMQPYKIVFIVESPGIYRIQFDNSYSWYNEKLVRFRSFVLEPKQDELEIRKIIQMPKQQKYFKPKINVHELLKQNQNKILIYMNNFDSIDFKLSFNNNQSLISIKQDYLNPHSNFNQINEQVLNSILMKQQTIYDPPVSVIIIANNDILSHFIRQFRKKNNQYVQDILIQVFFFITKFKNYEIEILNDCDVLYQLFLDPKYMIQVNQQFLVVKLNMSLKKLYSVLYSNEATSPTMDLSQLLDQQKKQKFKIVFEKSDNIQDQLNILQRFIVQVIKISVTKTIDHIFLVSQQDIFENQDQFQEFIHLIRAQTTEVPPIEIINQSLDDFIKLN